MALAVLALLVGVVGVTARPTSALPEEMTAAESVRVTLEAARRTALRTRRRVTVTVLVAGEPRAATALPDGSIVADAALGVDRLTGEWRGRALGVAR